MKTSRRRAAATLSLVLGVVLLVAAVAARLSSPSEPVYTVAQVHAGLAHQPAAWVGRTVLVREVAFESSWIGRSSGGGSWCPGSIVGPRSCPLAAPNGVTLYLKFVDDSGRLDPRRPFFIPPQANLLTLDLAMQPVAPNPLIALARRVPPLARFLPAPGQVPGGVSHLYRVHLRSAGTTSCNGFPFTCATGVLLDAQP